MINVPHPTKPIRVWGIDLGTTNSTISEIVFPATGQSDTPVCRPIELSQDTELGIMKSPLVPSVVIYDDVKLWVGEGAKRLRRRASEYVSERNLFYETKNLMGLRRTFPKAREDLNAPWKVAGKILQFLTKSAQAKTGGSPDRVVVTVPASFQLNQRLDTLKAAEAAGLALQDYDLLDEPVAALIAYIMSEDGQIVLKNKVNHCTLVVDFGGGTCDVTIMDLRYGGDGELPEAAMRSVSRYHRIGGGDIDAAIVHNILLPSICRENNIDIRSLGWQDKKKRLEPQLLATAEALKTAMCEEIERRRELKLDCSNDSGVYSEQPPVICKLGNRDLMLRAPRLEFSEWRTIISPFIARDALYARDTDYCHSQSVFAPIEDAIERSGLAPGDVDLVLMVGGSSLIPDVREAVRQYFIAADVVSFKDALENQIAISRGAAWHAYILEITERPFIRPIVHDDLGLVTESGEALVLIEKGVHIPYPLNGRKVMDGLIVPKRGTRELALDLMTLPRKQLVFHETWHFRKPADAGMPITLEYRLSANQELECTAYLPDRAQERITLQINNPLVAAVSPHKTLLNIEDAEEQLRSKTEMTRADMEMLGKLARWYAELAQYERALDYLRAMMRRIGERSDLLNLMGNYYAELGDIVNAEENYAKASDADPTDGSAWFNASLLLGRHKRFDEAMRAVGAALEREPQSGPYHTQKGSLLQKMGLSEEARQSFVSASECYGKPEDMSTWELGWYGHLAFATQDEEKRRLCDQERRRRKDDSPSESADDKARPKLA